MESDVIGKAVARTHEVFVMYASMPPRFKYLADGGDLIISMQMDVYKMSSKSPRVISTKTGMAKAFFRDLEVAKWSLMDLNAFKIATWARGRVSGGTKSAARTARCTLMLVEAATEVNMHLDNSLVKAQLASSTCAVGHAEPSTKAKDIHTEYIIKFEELVSSALTTQQRCYAGLFSLLACTSLRASDALRTRTLGLLDNAISGVSRMKSKKTWTKWFAPCQGFSGSCWVELWLMELSINGLPDHDFILKGVNSAGDEWCERPATYADVRRMMHLMLMVYLGLPAEDAVGYNPHGFRHVLVTAAQQLKHFGVVKEDELEVLGHWSRGSSMPRNYDMASGVTEMKVRNTVMSQFRKGWRPAQEGSYPSPPIPDEVSKVVRVAHKKSKKVHIWGTGIKTKCGIWTCGSVDAPTTHATFDGIPDTWDHCSQCG